MTEKTISYYHNEFKWFMIRHNQWNRFKFLLFTRYGVSNHRKFCINTKIRPEGFISVFPAVLLHRNRKKQTEFLKINLAWQTYYYKLD